MNKKQFNAQMARSTAHVRQTKTTTDGLTAADVFALIASRQQASK